MGGASSILDTVGPEERVELPWEALTTADGMCLKTLYKVLCYDLIELAINCFLSGPHFLSS